MTTGERGGLNFVAGAPNSRAIAPEDEMTPENAVLLSGKILDRSCNPVKDALVEVWYAGGAKSKL